jgi:hypothetical protein
MEKQILLLNAGRWFGLECEGMDLDTARVMIPAEV